MQLPINTVAAKVWEIPLLLRGQNFENNKNKKEKKITHLGTGNAITPQSLKCPVPWLFEVTEVWISLFC